MLTVREGKRTGLAVWRLETIHRATPQGREPVDRIGRAGGISPRFPHQCRGVAGVFLAGTARGGRHRR